MTLAKSDRFALEFTETLAEDQKPTLSDGYEPYYLIAKLGKAIRFLSKFRPSLYAAHAAIALGCEADIKSSWHQLRTWLANISGHKVPLKGLVSCDALLFYSSAKPSWQQATELLAKQLTREGFRVAVLTSQKLDFLNLVDGAVTWTKYPALKSLAKYGLSTAENRKAVLAATFDTMLLFAALITNPSLLIQFIRNPLNVFYQLALSHQRASVITFLIAHIRPRFILLNGEHLPFGSELATVDVKEARRVLFFNENPLPCFSDIRSDEVWVWNSRAEQCLRNVLHQDVDPCIEIVGRSELDFLKKPPVPKAQETDTLELALQNKRGILFLAESIPGDSAEMLQREALTWLALASQQLSDWVFIFKQRPFHHGKRIKGQELVEALPNWIFPQTDLTLRDLLHCQNVEVVVGITTTALTLAPGLGKVSLRLFPARNFQQLPVTDELTIPINSPTQLITTLKEFDQVAAQYHIAITERIHQLLPFQGQVVERMKRFALRHLNQDAPVIAEEPVMTALDTSSHVEQLPSNTQTVTATEAKPPMTPLLPNNSPRPTLAVKRGPAGPGEVDVLLLIEHVARELDVACAIKTISEKRYGITVDVRNVYHDVPALVEHCNPRIVVFPSFYSAKDLANKDYVKRWPNATFVNLAWEEIFYKGHVQLKAPSDDFSKTQILHHAWGNFYRDYLVQHEVQPDNIFVNGNPAYQLYLAPYRNVYPGREKLATSYRLDPNKRWVFIPENYRWAFIADSTIEWRVKQGANRAELKQMRAYAQISLREMLRWCNNVARGDICEVIVRPKPATQKAEMESFFSRHVVETAAPSLHFEKGDSVREWILASDITISSFSTSLIEAAIAGKPAAMVEPAPLTEAFQADWYAHLTRLETEEAFAQACNGNLSCNSSALSAWAMSEMLCNGDPIERFAELLNDLVSKHLTTYPSYQAPTERFKLSRDPSKYFNIRTHENDVFTMAEVNDRCARFSKALGLDNSQSDSLATPSQVDHSGEKQMTTTGPYISFVICTFNRAEILKNCLESFATQQYHGKDIEVTVVDNNSTDDTEQLVNSYLSTFPYTLRHVREVQQGLSHARNRGFACSSGEYIVYLDDDAMIPPYYILEMKRILTNYAPDLMGGPVYPYYTTPKPAWFNDEIEVRKYAQESGFSSRCNVSGGNFTIRRELLSRLGLFDPQYGMTGNSIGMLEERKVLELYRAQTPKESQKVYYSLECYINHHTPAAKMSVRYLVERAVTTGASARRMFCELKETYDTNDAISSIIQGSLYCSTGIDEIQRRENKPSSELLADMLKPLRNAAWGLGNIHYGLETGNIQLTDDMLCTIASAGKKFLELRAKSSYFNEEDFAEIRSGLVFLEPYICSIEFFYQQQTGKMSALNRFPDFDEGVYLEQNPDVECAVNGGIYMSGWEHFIRCGHKESRVYKLSDKGKVTERSRDRVIDVLFLVEHVARELDVVCAAKTLLERKLGLSVEIRHLTYHINDTLRRCYPRVVVLPYFYTVADQAIEEYATRWPSSIFMNLAWEEIFFNGHLKIKAPADDAAKNHMIHHAWGKFYQSYLVENGVNPDLIFLNGNPVYQLYQPEYRDFYPTREELANRYELDPKKKWVLIPENYRWAFINDKIIDWRVTQGANREELIEMRKYAQTSLATLLGWCNELALEGRVELIVRPKPATSRKEMERFFREAFGTETPPNYRIIKDETVREWILASDVVISSFSTTLIEAAIADKPIYMVEPLPLPDSFAASWYNYVPRIVSQTEFQAACVAPMPNNGIQLKQWATDTMLTQGDPIERLAGFIYNLVEDQRTLVPSVKETVSNDPLRGIPYRYYDHYTHEADIFGDHDVNKRVAKWTKIFGIRQAPGELKAEIPQPRTINTEPSRQPVAAQPSIESRPRPLRPIDTFRRCLPSPAITTIAPTPSQVGKHERIIPPIELRRSGKDETGYINGGDMQLNLLIKFAGLTPKSKILEIGCGDGRLASALCEYLDSDGVYSTFEVQEKFVTFLKNNISTLHPNFSFVHADLWHSYYNPQAKVRPEHYTFPFEDQAYDIVWLNSVFTHFCPPVSDHFLSQIARKLRPGGCLAATHCVATPEAMEMDSRGQSAADLRLGRSTLFNYRFKDYWARDQDKVETFIIVDEEWLRKAHQRHGFEIENVLWGSWCGRTNNIVHQQDLIIARKHGADYILRPVGDSLEAQP